MGSRPSSETRGSNELPLLTPEHSDGACPRQSAFSSATRPGEWWPAILGDGALHYTVSVLWTAARYRVPVVFVVARRPAPDRSAPAAPARHLSATAVGSFDSLSGQTAGLCAATTGEGERWR